MSKTIIDLSREIAAEDEAQFNEIFTGAGQMPKQNEAGNWEVSDAEMRTLVDAARAGRAKKIEQAKTAEQTERREFEEQVWDMDRTEFNKLQGRILRRDPRAKAPPRL